MAVRILRIINRFNLGGPTYNAALLTRHLQPDYETRLVAGMKDETEASSEHIVRDLGIEPEYIPDMYREISPLNDWKAYRHICRLIREFKPDIVHTHAAKAGLLGRLAAWRMGVPVVVHTFHGHVFHSYFGPLKTRLFLFLERFCARLSNGIVAISELQRQELVGEFRIAPAAKFRVIPLGFDLDRFQDGMQAKRTAFRLEFGLKEEQLAIGLIGRLVPIKNHRMFLEAFKLLLERTNQPVRAVIVGDGECRPEIESVCDELGLSRGTDAGSQVVFTSWITDVDRALAGLDVIALSSHNEGTPVSLIEAQASGKPIVSTRVGGVADTVLENQSAILVEAGDSERMGAELARLSEDASLRAAMGSAGIAQAFENFHYSALVTNFDHLYRSLLRKGTE